MSKSDFGKLICGALLVLAIVCRCYTMLQKNSVSP